MVQFEPKNYVFLNIDQLVFILDIAYNYPLQRRFSRSRILVIAEFT